MQWLYKLSLALCAVCLITACGSDEDNGGDTQGGGTSACDKQTQGTGIDRFAKLQVSQESQPVNDASTINVVAGGLDTGTEIDTTLTLRNVAAIISALELRVTGVSISYTKPQDASDAGKPFECFIKLEDGSLEDCDTADLGTLVPADADADFCVTGTRRTSLPVVVRFTKQDDEITRQVLLKVFTQNDATYDGKAFQVRLITKGGAPKAALSPQVVDFDVVKLGEQGEKKLSIFNQGEANLEVSQVDITPKNGKPIELEVDGKVYKGGTVVEFSPPLVVVPQKSVAMLVKYSANSAAPYQDAIHVQTNDKGGIDKDGRYSVVVIANQKVPCLKVIPANQVNFGFVPIGTEGKRKVELQSCGDADVTITDVLLKEDKQDIFTVDTSAISSLGGKPVSADNPLVLKINEKVSVSLSCSPEAENKDSDDKPAPYTAKLAMTDNTIQPSKDISLNCWGTTTNCPTPVIVSQEGEEIIPQQELNLVGSQSFAGPSQKVVKWKWSVLKKPKGSDDHKFWPNAGAPDVKFGAKTTQQSGEVISVNIAGEYVFQLEVWDDANTLNCIAAKQTVLVIPNEAIHVELLWDNPEDKDKLDTGLGAGSDMDLHFAHPSAQASKVCTDPPEMCNGNPCKCQEDFDKDGKADPWFHSLYDCFWFNQNPNWASLDPAIDDNPGLDLDDTDGWGPENMNLKEPEVNKVYRVGVHYWDAHSFGDAIANVRIYILGVLTADMTSTPMKECDFWWVKDIDWPSGKLLDVETGKTNGKYSPAYKPKFAKALGGKCSD
ncbi:MAG TPA: hypothetical protein DCQ06_05115 [Myxococcales bacterium]|nr:hypothetical protein [Myxococcales bacterium]HAN30957.1 hypothetical protein [Myxococcales bacterium]